MMSLGLATAVIRYVNTIALPDLSKVLKTVYTQEKARQSLCCGGLRIFRYWFGVTSRHHLKWPK
jgi:hypothetical protein